MTFRALGEELLHALRLRELGPHAGDELLPHARHAEEERRLDLAQVLEELLHRLGEVDRRALRDRRVDREDLLGDVRERQIRERSIGAVGLHHLPRALRRPSEVLVREHHGLRRPRRARGVDERREAIRLERVEALVEARVVDAVALRDERVPRDRLRVIGRRDAAHEHDVHDGGQLGEDLLDLLPLREILDEHDLRGGVAGDVLDLVAAELVV